MRPLQDRYIEFLNAEDYSEIEAESLRLLKARKHWDLRDAARSWSEATISVLIKKGLMRPIDLVEAERIKVKIKP